MSFRRFVYYCAVCGAWFALLGWTAGSLASWASGTLLGSEDPTQTSILLHASVLGLCLGVFVALGLSGLDALWNLPLRQIGQMLLRVLTAVIVGGLGGLIGGFFGQLLIRLTTATETDATASGGLVILSALFFFAGWTLVGLLVGAAIAAFEAIRGLMSKRGRSAGIRKLIKCVLGGTLGGFLGATIAYGIRALFSDVIFSDKDPNRLLSPTAIGFVALGACIGLLVGLTQVLLREAWIRVEAGFRPGRQLILSKEKTSVGRAEGSDIPLFGDNGVEKLHAHIVLDGGRYYLEEAGPGQGTYVNDQKIEGRVALSSGDVIRVGKSLLRFSERRKR